MDKKACPCGSGKEYAACCGPVISGKAAAPTAEALMRARYSAYVKAEIGFIADSCVITSYSIHYTKLYDGYTRGFADPEFVKVLPVFQLPFLSRDKKYRTFQISGDSMLPIPDGSYNFV